MQHRVTGRQYHTNLNCCQVQKVQQMRTACVTEQNEHAMHVGWLHQHRHGTNIRHPTRCQNNNTVPPAAAAQALPLPLPLAAPASCGVLGAHTGVPSKNSLCSALTARCASLLSMMSEMLTCRCSQRQQAARQIQQVQHLQFCEPMFVQCLSTRCAYLPSMI